MPGSGFVLGGSRERLVSLECFCARSVAVAFLFAVCFVFASIVVPITPPPGNYELEGGISV